MLDLIAEALEAHTARLREEAAAERRARQEWIDRQADRCHTAIGALLGDHAGGLQWSIPDADAEPGTRLTAISRTTYGLLEFSFHSRTDGGVDVLVNGGEDGYTVDTFETLGRLIAGDLIPFDRDIDDEGRDVAASLLLDSDHDPDPDESASECVVCGYPIGYLTVNGGQQVNSGNLMHATTADVDEVKAAALLAALTA